MNRSKIPYSNRDYESLRQSLLAKIPLLTDKWTDFNDSDLGIVLLDLFCGIGDMLAFYQDSQASEAFLPTARQRTNVINLCKLISYRLDSIISSSTSVTFSLKEALPSDLILPQGLLCRAPLEDQSIDFVTVEEGLIPAGALFVELPVIQGTPKSFEFDALGIQHEMIHVPFKNLAQGFIEMSIDGNAWNEVFHFQDSDRDSNDFIVDVDAIDQTTISMGDGVRGALADSGAEGIVHCLQSLGEKGNVGRDTITQLISTVEHEGSPVVLSITNIAPATGGASRESLAHAKKQAPAELETLWKAVTLDDYKALAEGFSGISKAEVMDTNICSNIRYYSVNLAVAPMGGGLPSAYLKKKLEEFLIERKVITVEVRLFDPIYRPVNIDLEVYAWPDESVSLVKSRVRNALENNFHFDNMSFGKTIHNSDLISLVDGVQGVSHLKMYAPSKDIVLGKGEIPILGQLNLDVRRAS